MSELTGGNPALKEQQRKAMRIYLQELSSTVYTSTLSPLVRGRGEAFAAVSAAVWKKTFERAAVGASGREIIDLCYAELIPQATGTRPASTP